MLGQGSDECSQFFADDRGEGEVSTKVAFCEGGNYVTGSY